MILRLQHETLCTFMLKLYRIVPANLGRVISGSNLKQFHKTKQLVVNDHLLLKQKDKDIMLKCPLFSNSMHSVH